MLSYPVEMLYRLQAVREYLRGLRTQKRLYVSASRIALKLNLGINLLAEDISHIGIPCHSQTELAVNPLIDAIEIFLGYHNESYAFIAGSGQLAVNIIHELQKEDCGLQIIAAFDSLPDAADAELPANVKVFPLEKMNSLAGRMHINLGILACAEDIVRKACTCMERSGISVIWNLSGFEVQTDEKTILENGSDSSGLALLMRRIKETRRTLP